MVTDVQVRRLVSRLASGSTLEKLAMSADMSEKTARKYVALGKFPSELRGSPRSWLTREDPLAEVWDEVRERLEQGPGLQAKTLL